MAIVHAAMFDAVNSIERRYVSYLVQFPADVATSKEAAAATAAAGVLSTIDAKTAGEMRAALPAYLASIPDCAAKSDGVKLGEAIAARIIEARANDGCDVPDAYRPRTSPGVYVPTAIPINSMWPNLKPFAIANGSQFRPAPPVALDSAECKGLQRDQGIWSTAQREATEQQPRRRDSGSPLDQRLIIPCTAAVTAKQMDVVDSARHGVRLVWDQRRAVAVLDAKYHYNFCGQSPPFAMATSTATRRQSLRQPGSRSPPRRCTRSTHARTASRAGQSQVSSRRYSEAISFPKLRRKARPLPA